MTIEEMEAKARELAHPWHASVEGSRDLARFVLLVMPVVRAAMYWRSEENYMGDRRVGMRALVDAVDTMRAALEGK